MKFTKFWHNSYLQVNDAKINRKRNHCNHPRNAITQKSRIIGTERTSSTTSFKTYIFCSNRSFAQRKEGTPQYKIHIEHLKKNETSDISENEIEEYLNQIIDLNLFFNKKD